MVIDAKQNVVTNLQHFTKHLERISYDVQTAAIVMNGFDPNLFHNKAKAVCQHEHFGIESPALNALTGEGQPCGLAFESFETALSVFKAQPEYGLDHHLEPGAAQTPVPGCCRTGPASLYSARAN